MNETIKYIKEKLINTPLLCWISLVIACLFVISFTLIQSNQKAYADLKVATIKLSQALTSKQGQEMQQTFPYTFEAISENAPMPIGSQGSKYIFQITGSTDYSFDISMTIPSGNTPFKYKLYMNIPEAQEYYTFDNNVYDVEIYASLTQYPFIFYFNQEKEKLTQPPCFKVIYDEPNPDPKPEPIPTPDSFWTPKTLDASIIFAIFVGAIGLVSFLLTLISKRQKKQKPN